MRQHDLLIFVGAVVIGAGSYLITRDLWGTVLSIVVLCAVWVAVVHRLEDRG